MVYATTCTRLLDRTDSAQACLSQEDIMIKCVELQATVLRRLARRRRRFAVFIPR